MYSIFYYILIYLFLGAVGMAIANRNIDLRIRRQRWLKYFFYILITGVVIAGIFLQFFRWLSILIIAAGLVELLITRHQDKDSFFIVPFIIYGLIASGFIIFSFHFDSPWLLFIYFQVLIFDAFGQITGQLFGKNLLMPSISPSKTIEGLAGGFLFCLVSAIFGAEWLDLSLSQALLFGLFTGVSSFCGDTLASWYKRLKKIKDFSNWLPGQGGFLDRFDSFIFTGFSYYWASIIFKNAFPVK